MGRVSCFIIAFALVFAASHASGEETIAKATIRDKDGNRVGYVIITEGDVVTVTYNLAGLPPGVHAFHIHGTGLCEPPFTSAGGHFNPFGREHGLKDPAGPHAGDMINIVVAPDGTASGVRYAPLVTLMEGKKGSLLKEGGTVIVIHAGQDDYMTDPAGDAGPRIACGVIIKTKERK